MAVFHSFVGTTPCWAVIGLVVAACGTQEAASPPEAPLALEASPRAEPQVAEPADQAEPVALNNTEDYKAEQLRLAMRGITYTGGVLAIDAEVAPSIASRPDAEASAAALAKGRKWIDLNHRDEAVAAMTRAVLYAPESAAAYEGLGDALTVRRKYPEALAAFRAGLARAPESASLHAKLADGLVRADERVAAIEELRHALQLDPQNAAARERLALQLYYTGDSAAAWAEVHAAEAQGHPVPPQFRELLARAYPEPSRSAEVK